MQSRMKHWESAPLQVVSTYAIWRMLVSFRTEQSDGLKFVAVPHLSLKSGFTGKSNLISLKFKMRTPKHSVEIPGVKNPGHAITMIIQNGLKRSWPQREPHSTTISAKKTSRRATYCLVFSLKTKLADILNSTLSAPLRSLSPGIG